VASELEFYVFQETYQSASEKRWHDLKTHTNFNVSTEANLNEKKIVKNFN
jgi:hypothetical protein